VRVYSGGNVTDTYYIGDHFEVKGGETIKYIFAGNLRVAQVKGTTRSFFHKDHLGSSTVMTDASGAVIESTEYAPFGSQRVHTGTNTSDYRYTDQELDAENGLYNYNARLYDPFIGRFISADTIVPQPYNPQSLNRYSYVLNNPLIYIDPSGHHNSTPGVYGDGNNPWSSVDWWNSVGGINFWGPVFGPAAYAEMERMNIVVRSRTANVTAGPFPDGQTLTSKEYFFMAVPDTDQFMRDLNGNLGINNSMGGVGGSGNAELISKTVDAIGSIGDGMSETKGSFSFMNSRGQDYFRYYAPTLSRPKGWAGSGYVTTYNISKLGSYLSRTAGVLSVMKVGFDVWQGFEKDNRSFGHNTQLELFRGVGGLVGGYAGSAVFGFVGLEFGGVGAIPGCLIGAVIGSRDGYVFGERFYYKYVY
jgi:RHS repeat-associated protein